MQFYVLKRLVHFCKVYEKLWYLEIIDEVSCIMSRSNNASHVESIEATKIKRVRCHSG